MEFVNTAIQRQKPYYLRATEDGRPYMGLYVLYHHVLVLAIAKAPY